MTVIDINSLDDLDAAAAKFLDALAGRTVVAFHGQMGAGKTTFINALARHLGVTDDATGSPTFAIVNEYRSASGRPIYHFDVYRIESIYEALDFGIEDYFDSGNLCLIEWPERIEQLLPDDVVIADISVAENGARRITIRN